MLSMGSWRYRTALLPLSLALVVVLAEGCGEDDSKACVGTVPAEAGAIATTLRFVDERGAPVPGVTLALAASEVRGAGDGRVKLTLRDGPAVGIASAPGYLAEPVTIGVGDAGGEVVVRLLADTNGRFVVHSAGDVMFGRRYEEPPSGDALVPRGDADSGARRVVEHVKRTFVAADLRTLNLETAVSDAVPEQAAPGKRFILRTRPGALGGVRELGASVAILANNHVRDYRDEGVAETLAALDAAGIPFVGARTDDRPGDPVVTTVRGSRVGILAYTTINGSFVNDSYPIDGATIEWSPGRDAWQYEARSWGFAGDALSVPALGRRIGSAWRVFDDAERKGLGREDANDGFRSLAGVYPELQDWVARRGHGGASPWSPETSPAAIAALRKSADLVMVQLHAGFQFQEAAGATVESMAHAAIDAGADVVVCHHPHVLQGMEWYKGKLIAYSLGNFVFDQDFLSTFSSVILRTVWEGTGAGRSLVEARLIPVEIAGYRPTIATDTAAKATLRRIWERSLLRARSERVGGAVRAFAAEPSAGTVPAQLTFERHTARVTAIEQRGARTIALAPGETKRLEEPGLIDPRLEQADGVRVGRDLFGWGRFEDELADDGVSGKTHWDVGTCDEAVAFGGGASGRAALRLRRTSKNTKSLSSRPVARTPLSRHRFFDRDGALARPLDPAATYSIRLQARRAGAGEASLKLDFYRFDDTDPTEDPSSEIVSSTVLPLSVPDDRGWHLLELPIDPATLGPESIANMVLFYIRLSAAGSTTVLDIDDMSLIEWRPAAQMRDAFGAYDFLKNDSTSKRTVTLTTLVP
jgi:poly-gamma-glutamate capsule biosynthesis protein CapA/YwtB (metallophosphatase superfamily)